MADQPAKSPQEDQADQLLKEGRKLVGVSKGMFGMKGKKVEEGCAMMVKAANLYKMKQLYDKAGDTFVEVAKVEYRLDNKVDACGAYMDAGKCYVKQQPELALKCHLKAAEIYVDRGRLVMGGKQYLAAAEIYETRMNDPNKSMLTYKKAVEMFEAENQEATASKAIEKLATLQMISEKYMDAKMNFEKLATIANSRPLLRFGVKDHYFRACLCAFAMDHIHAKVLVKQFVDEHPAFRDCREYELLVNLLEAFNEDSVEMFDSAIEKYRMISSCHKWLLNVLEKIRATMPSVCGWSELEGDVAVNPTSADRNPVLAQNRFLPATYLTKATTFFSSSSRKPKSASNSANAPDTTNKYSLSFQNLSSNQRDDDQDFNAKTNFSVPLNVNTFESSNPFSEGNNSDYNYDETNPFSDSYRDANEEDLDLS